MLGVVLLVTGGLWALQRRLVHVPDQHVGPVPAGVEEVTAPTDDGLALRGWLVPADDPGAPLLVVLHGNAGDRADRLPLAEALRPHGIATLLTDYRGYGGNPGRPSEAGLRADARAWRRWAEDHHDGPVALYGGSIGAAPAVWAAAEDPPAALVLRSPFPSLAAVARRQVPLPGLRWLLRDRYEVLAASGRVTVPTLVVAGTADDLVPAELSWEVADALGGPVERLAVDGAGHNDLALFAGGEVVTAIAALLR